MKYGMPLNSDDYIGRIIDIFSCMPPFSKLTDKEKIVFGEYIKVYKKYKEKLSNEDIFRIYESYDFKKNVSDVLTKIDGENATLDTIRNYSTKLRKKGFLVGNTIPEKFLYLFDNVKNEITFVLEIKD